MTITHINENPTYEHFPEKNPRARAELKFKMMLSTRVGDQVRFVDPYTIMGTPSLEAYLDEGEWWELGMPQSIDITVTAVAGRTMHAAEAEVRLLEENEPIEKRLYKPLDKDEVVR